MRREERPLSVDGVPVGRRSVPESEEELAATLAEASRAGEAVVFRGGGTRLDRGAPPERVDLLVDLGGCRESSSTMSAT